MLKIDVGFCIICMIVVVVVFVIVWMRKICNSWKMKYVFCVKSLVFVVVVVLVSFV